MAGTGGPRCLTPSRPYFEAIDGVTYGEQGGHDEIKERFYAAAEACLDVGEPGWRERL